MFSLFTDDTIEYFMIEADSCSFLFNVYITLVIFRYVPTRLWGFSGHVQTVLHSIIGRVRCPWPIGDRVFLNLRDGTTLTYDVYQPLDVSFEGIRLAQNTHRLANVLRVLQFWISDDITIAICPGIGNTSESVYIRTFVHWSQCHGYRCAVLNHVGALRSVPVTAPRIFSYGATAIKSLILFLNCLFASGNTSDFHEMILHLVGKHPNTRIVCVGFSLGGNLVTKYMGEPEVERPAQIIGGISVCQGYCAIEYDLK